MENKGTCSLEDNTKNQVEVLNLILSLCNESTIRAETLLMDIEYQKKTSDQIKVNLEKFLNRMLKNLNIFKEKLALVEVDKVIKDKEKLNTPIKRPLLSLLRKSQDEEAILDDEPTEKCMKIDTLSEVTQNIDQSSNNRQNTEKNENTTREEYFEKILIDEDFDQIMDEKQIESKPIESSSCSVIKFGGSSSVPEHILERRNHVNHLINDSTDEDNSSDETQLDKDNEETCNNSMSMSEKFSLIEARLRDLGEGSFNEGDKTNIEETVTTETVIVTNEVSKGADVTDSDVTYIGEEEENNILKEKNVTPDINKMIDTFLNELELKRQEEVDEELAKKIINELEKGSDLEDSDLDIENKLMSLTSTDTEADDEMDNYNETLKKKKMSKKKKKAVVYLTPIDKISYKKMRKLCSENGLDDKKCDVFKDILKEPQLKRKKARVLSTSSSSSENISNFSDFDDNSLKDDSEYETVPFEMRSKRVDEDDDEALAEEICKNLNCNIEQSSTEDEQLSEKEEEEIKKKKDNKSKANEKLNNDLKNKNKKRRIYEKLLTEKLWSSSSSESNNEDKEILEKEGKKEDEKVIKECTSQENITKLQNDADDSSEIEIIEDYNDSDIEFISETLYDGKKRRKIREILPDEKLTQETQDAIKEEDFRIKRLTERTKMIDTVQSQTEELVLDIDPKTGKPLIVVDFALKEMLKPHQIDGIKFMWKACYESVEMIEKGSGTGCILAHCMGLGKTLQIITLIHTLFSHKKFTKTNHVLIIVPLSVVWNWKQEFTAALKHVNYDYKLIFIEKGTRESKIYRVKWWKNKGGVLVMSYNCYVNLVGESLKSDGLPEMREALLDPGPDLIVCDEGHLIKNEKTGRSRALAKVKTKRRICLTGTPLQNNLVEYYYMVEFVKPKYLGTVREYKNRFATPITNGQFYDSDRNDILLMKKRTHVLNRLLKQTIHRVDSNVLKSYLPPIYDFVLFIKMNNEQSRIYKEFVNNAKSKALTTNSFHGFLQDFHLCQLLCFHPRTINEAIRNKSDNNNKSSNSTREDEQRDNNKISEKERWLQKLLPSDVDENMYYSTKLIVLFRIIDACKKINEKILIFSASLEELSCLEFFFNKRGFKKNLNYYRMDGETKPNDRSYLCQEFNKPNKTVDIFLISHKVGGLGLNLTGASRVILLETNFNPSHDSQSIYRVYRFGQTKKVYIYRLISSGTMDEKNYFKCLIKLSVASTVIDKFHVDRHVERDGVGYMYEYEEKNEPRHTPSLPPDNVLANVLQQSPEIVKYHEQQALLENRPDEELNDEDKKLAWNEFNNLNVQQNMTINNGMNIPNNNNNNLLLPNTSIASTSFQRPQFSQQKPTKSNVPWNLNLPKSPNPINNFDSSKAVFSLSKLLANHNLLKPMSVVPPKKFVLDPEMGSRLSYIRNPNTKQDKNVLVAEKSSKKVNNKGFQKSDESNLTTPIDLTTTIKQRNKKKENKPSDNEVVDITDGHSPEFNYALNCFV